KQIKSELEEEELVQSDPKREVVFEKIKSILDKEPNRKIVLFTEYTDTVLHLEPFFRGKLGNRLLICDGGMNRTLQKALEQNFNAQYEGTHYDDFDVLITSDKLSEGFNLNRAGVIINYDIPWNPTRVIQRVGRINRIGKKVFDQLYLFNFFPSEIGADYVKSREIASQKMFMIHNSLGEDAQIFATDEEPTASGLYNRMNQDPEVEDEKNLLTDIRNRYEEIKQNFPEVIERIEKLPNRVKTSKKSEFSEVNTLRRKGLALFSQRAETEDKSEVESMSFSDFINQVECDYETKRLPLSGLFWPTYEK